MVFLGNLYTCFCIRLSCFLMELTLEKHFLWSLLQCLRVSHFEMQNQGISFLVIYSVRFSTMNSVPTCLSMVDSSFASLAGIYRGCDSLKMSKIKEFVGAKFTRNSELGSSDVSSGGLSIYISFFLIKIYMLF